MNVGGNTNDTSHVTTNDTPSNLQMQQETNAGTDHVSTSVIDGVSKKVGFTLAPAKLKSESEKLERSNKISRGEGSATNQSTSKTVDEASCNTAVKKVQKTVRARNNAQRNAAKGNNLYLQDQITPKRARIPGETPPSSSQPTKKKKNRKPKKKGQESKGTVDNQSQPNVQHGHDTVASVPPGVETPQSIGPDAAVTTNVEPIDVDALDDPNGENDTRDHESYADVASNLCTAIIDQRGPNSMTLLDQKKFDILSSLITDLILSQAGKGVSPPTFEDTRLHSGSMRVRCANFHARKWLEKFIPTLDKSKLWKDAALKVIDFGDIPKPHKFNVFVRGLKKSAQDIFKLFEMQNKGITTKGWTALACESKNDGTQMTIGVGADSFEKIRQRSNTLFCGLGQTTFYMVKGCKENRDALHASAKQPRSDAKNDEPTASSSHENVDMKESGTS